MQFALYSGFGKGTISVAGGLRLSFRHRPLILDNLEFHYLSLDLSEPSAYISHLTRNHFSKNIVFLSLCLFQVAILPLKFPFHFLVFPLPLLTLPTLILNEPNRTINHGLSSADNSKHFFLRTSLRVPSCIGIYIFLIPDLNSQ